uniref:Glycoprotein n=1 Tax=Hemipteran rhabdo-related virus OKIAV30 TaxID=2746291 RepID=A0A7D7F789_9RHAB|nr:glycoprotein [Hemipteran rhabdo-related virus OKIAV30]
MKKISSMMLPISVLLLVYGCVVHSFEIPSMKASTIEGKFVWYDDRSDYITAPIPAPPSCVPPSGDNVIAVPLNAILWRLNRKISQGEALILRERVITTKCFTYFFGSKKLDRISDGYNHTFSNLPADWLEWAEKNFDSLGMGSVITYTDEDIYTCQWMVEREKTTSLYELQKITIEWTIDGVIISPFNRKGCPLFTDYHCSVTNGMKLILKKPLVKDACPYEIKKMAPGVWTEYPPAQGGHVSLVIPSLKYLFWFTSVSVLKSPICTKDKMHIYQTMDGYLVSIATVANQDLSIIPREDWNKGEVVRSSRWRSRQQKDLTSEEEALFKRVKRDLRVMSNSSDDDAEEKDLYHKYIHDNSSDHQLTDFAPFSFSSITQEYPFHNINFSRVGDKTYAHASELLSIIKTSDSNDSLLEPSAISNFLETVDRAKTFDFSSFKSSPKQKRDIDFPTLDKDHDGLIDSSLIENSYDRAELQWGLVEIATKTNEDLSKMAHSICLLLQSDWLLAYHNLNHDPSQMAVLLTQNVRTRAKRSGNVLHYLEGKYLDPKDVSFTSEVCGEHWKIFISSKSQFFSVKSSTGEIDIWEPTNDSCTMLPDSFVIPLLDGSYYDIISNVRHSGLGMQIQLHNITEFSWNGQPMYSLQDYSGQNHWGQSVNNTSPAMNYINNKIAEVQNDVLWKKIMTLASGIWQGLTEGWKEILTIAMILISLILIIYALKTLLLMGAVKKCLCGEPVRSRERDRKTRLRLV